MTRRKVPAGRNQIQSYPVAVWHHCGRLRAAGRCGHAGRGEAACCPSATTCLASWSPRPCHHDLARHRPCLPVVLPAQASLGPSPSHQMHYGLRGIAYSLLFSACLSALCIEVSFQFLAGINTCHSSRFCLKPLGGGGGERRGVVHGSAADAL